MYVCAAGMEEESPPFFEEDESLLIIKSLLHAAGKHACHIRPHTSAYVTYASARPHKSAYVTCLRIRQHTVSTRMRTYVTYVTYAAAC